MKGRLLLLLRGLRLMTRAEATSGALIVLLMMFAGLIESAIVALIIPMVYVIIDPAQFASTSVGRWLSGMVRSGSIEDTFVYLAAIFVVLLILASCASTLSRFVSERHSARCVNRLAHEVLQRCLDAPYVWVVRQNAAGLAHYILDDVGSWRTNFVTPMFLMLQAAIMIVSPAAVAIIFAPLSALIALMLVGLIAGILLLLFRKKIRRESEHQRTLARKMRETLAQIVLGIREIKISHRSEFFIKSFDKAHYASTYGGAALRLWIDAPTNIILLLGQIGFVSAALVLFLTNTSRVDIAAHLALIGIVVTRVLPATNRLVSQVPRVVQSLPYVQALLRLIDDLDSTRNTGGRASTGAPVPVEWGSIELGDVWFRYFERNAWALRGVDLKLEQGKFYGFAGRSGAGKTTLVNMLLGLIEPARGSWKVNGRPLNDLSVASWQKLFGYVPQDPFILDGTILENITFGDENLDKLRLDEAIRRAQLSEVVQGLSSGLNTRVGERGRQVSGGQAQRIAIARALYRDPKILFLDEATSALDSITESEFQESIVDLRGHLTAFMIAHRVTSLQRCDRIFVLDQGQIVASGTYEELLRDSEVFRGLAAQAEKADDTVLPAPV